MLCPRCHAENRAGRRFCGECGLSLPSTCASCGFLNESGEKFCGGCGSPMSATAVTSQSAPSPVSYTPKHLAERILTSKAALEGERKQVTVLFADLKGSMELLADRDPEEARKIPTVSFLLTGSEPLQQRVEPQRVPSTFDADGDRRREGGRQKWLTCLAKG
jgi:Double zinc ribbon